MESEWSCKNYKIAEVCVKYLWSLLVFYGFLKYLDSKSLSAAISLRILFTRLRTEPHDMLQAIHDALSSSFMRHGFPVLDESAKSWLEEGEEPHDFKARFRPRQHTMMYNVLLMYVQKDARASHAVFAELISQLWKLREKTCLKSNHSIIFYPSLSKFQYYKSSNLQAHASFIKVSKALPSCRWNIWTIWSNRHSQGIAHQLTSFRIIPNHSESSWIELYPKHFVRLTTSDDRSHGVSGVIFSPGVGPRQIRLGQVSRLKVSTQDVDATEIYWNAELPSLDIY